MEKRELDYSNRAIEDLTQSVKLSLLMLPRDEAANYTSYLLQIADQLEQTAQAVEDAIEAGQTLEEALNSTGLHGLRLAAQD